MTENQSARPPIPLLKSNEEQLAKIRRQLKGVFRELRLAQDVIMVAVVSASPSALILTMKSNTSCVAAEPIDCPLC